MEELKSTIQKLLGYNNQANSLNEKVSNANVGWHIDHSLLVINKVLSQLEQSDEQAFQPSFSMKRFIVFFTNKFPVGKAKAPKAVKPIETFNSERTVFYGEKAFQKVEDALIWHANKNFKHPIFGWLNKKQTLRFLNIHTNHHLKIIEKIINS